MPKMSCEVRPCWTTSSPSRAWSLMGNFEWIFGYGERLGLHAVDPETFERTPKPSAGVYAAIVRAGGVG
jgi:beta-glucosidase/6-phospho-beta-glucosidase/beta-galactosidase